MSCKNPKENRASDTPAGQVRTSAMLLLRTQGIKKYDLVASNGMTFCYNQATDSKTEMNENKDATS
jgi:hypothetical protein